MKAKPNFILCAIDLASLTVLICAPRRQSPEHTVQLRPVLTLDVFLGLQRSAIASSTTIVMGYAAVRWLEKGEKLSNEALKKLTQGMTTILLDTLKSLGKRKPSQKGLRELITQSLESSPLAETRSTLDSEAGE